MLFSHIFRWNVSAGDLDDGMKCPLSRLADGPGLGGAVAMLEGRDAVQRDIKKPPVIGQSQMQECEDMKYEPRGEGLQGGG